MNQILSLPKFIAQLLCVVVAWNTFGSVSLADPITTSSLFDIAPERNTADPSGFWYTPGNNSEKHHTVFEEFISEEENQKDENEHHLDGGVFRNALSPTPSSEVAFFKSGNSNLLAYHTVALYIRYCSLKIPFHIS